jgi:Holliday junction resolvase-like predicted endonuclease
MVQSSTGTFSLLCLEPGIRSRHGRAEVAMDRNSRARRYGRLCEWGTLGLLWLQGWDLVARNLTVGRFELDLLMARGDDLRVVEVKARRRGTWVAGDTALGQAQRLRLQVALRGWLRHVPWPGRISFQRVSWSGGRWRFHPPERWESLAAGWRDPSPLLDCRNADTRPGILL